ncbi:ion transporter [Hugenholtzia roseola]|uniref:ion transporter n=1 Tax=Hugenholtzia roseola TaxID=1002 RepID=UPI0004160459|nr:ion transporter [Hugenholtzia roseola]
MQEQARRLTNSQTFEAFIIFVILVNCTLIGVETYFTNTLIGWIQQIAVIIFTLEIVLRWFARSSVKSFFQDGWNIFDLFIVIISLIPESLFADAALVTGIRVLRVFRVLRLFRTAPEIKLIVAVLVRSFSALTYNAAFFLIFMYLYAIVGVTLFRLPTPETATAEQKAQLAQYYQLAPNAPTIAPDPYGALDETFFTLFRALTGEDWTDLRYNLIKANEIGLIHSSPTVITFYHVTWFILAAFLLLNLLVGAILNNYQIIMDEQKTQRLKDEAEAQKNKKTFVSPQEGNNIEPFSVN